MSRLSPPTRAGLGIVVALSVVSVLVSLSVNLPYGGSSQPGPVNALSPLQATPHNATPIRLLLYNSSVEVGSPALFRLSVNGVNCSSGAPPNESVTQVVIRFGDGFNLQEPGIPETDCHAYAAPVSINLTYGYRTSGTYTISASVEWENGDTLSSNAVTLIVTGLPSTAAPVVDHWLGGAVAASIVIVAACFVLRRLLLPPPSLPPGAV